MYSIYVLVLLLFYPAHGSICIPKLSDGVPTMDNFKQIECEVSTCSSVSQLRFEKKIYNRKQWTPVYERFNETYHQSLDTNIIQYSLRNRSYYKDFNFKHILYINPPTLDDQGKWRCVVHDITDLKYASKGTDIFIYVTPPEKLIIVPKNVELYTNQTTEFMCMTDGIHPVPDVLWIVNGTDQHIGAPSNKQHADGLWSVMNTIQLSFDKVGLSDLSCIMRTNDRDRWMQNQIRILVKDTKNGNRPVTTLSYDINRTPSNINVNILNSPLFLTITYSVICVFGLMLGMLALWQVGKRVKRILQSLRSSVLQQRKKKEYQMISTVIDMQFHESLKRTKIIKMTEETESIWRSTQTDCVFVGGQNSPSVTVITYDAEPTRHLLPKGTSIVNGICISTTVHMINVRDVPSNTYHIYFVNIESARTAEQLTINATLTLSYEIKEPRCLFAIDQSSIGIYCARNRLIGVINIKDINKPTQVGKIKLTGYDANQNDLLCVNHNDHICVLSYNYRCVYIFNKRGEFIYNFNTGMWYDPIHIQRLSNNSLAVINLYGEIHHFDEDSKSEMMELDTNIHVQAAVFTKTLLWVIDALDSTNIHVFKTGVA